ncbi:hypothetical protein CRUP_016476 [Coryphaenoides rupestris]|nr:hypothetical protein CRUP_016476 [Coryphaenoides rupestris]
MKHQKLRRGGGDHDSSFPSILHLQHPPAPPTPKPHNLQNLHFITQIKDKASANGGSNVDTVEEEEEEEEEELTQQQQQQQTHRYYRAVAPISEGGGRRGDGEGGDGETARGETGGTEVHRVSILENGNLRIWNVTKVDAGVYTCVARNLFGVASSSGSVTQHSAGDIMIRNVQLKHAGKYTCAVQTKVDSISIAADLVVRGPPSPPNGIHVSEVSDTTVSLSWRPGLDNHSPITAYTIQARTPFSLGWQAVTTGAHYSEFSAALYEFRVLGSNAVGTGEPSRPSKQARTKETCT